MTVIVAVAEAQALLYSVTVPDPEMCSAVVAGLFTPGLSGGGRSDA